MTNVKFEGAIDDVDPRQLEYIVEVLSQLGYDESKATFEVVGKPGDNYMSKVKRLIVEKNNEKTFKLIVKLAPSEPGIRQYMQIPEAYFNEYVFYKEVIPKLCELEKSAEIPDCEKFKYPESFGFLTEEPYELIMLEDLGESKFVILDKNKSLNDQAVKLALLNFAKLHSLSYAWKKKDPKSFAELRLKFKELWDSKGNEDDNQEYFSGMEKDLMDMFEDEMYKNSINKAICNMEKYFQKTKIDAQTKFSVIVQGDAWTNNIMYRCEDNELVDCCMIDYQQPRISIPVSDILYMIFLCTDYETRSKHYHDWISYYHEQLDKCLDNFGLKANFVYPRDQLDADLKRHAKPIFSLTLFLHIIMKRDEEESAKLMSDMETKASNNKDTTQQEILDASRISLLKEGTLSNIRDVTKGLIDSYFDLGYM